MTLHLSTLARKPFAFVRFTNDHYLWRADLEAFYWLFAFFIISPLKESLFELTCMAVAKIFIGDVTVSLQKGHICCGTLVVTSKGFFL